MKKLIVLLIVMVTMSGCLVSPGRLSIHERRLWIHQNHPKEYYYKLHPTNREKVRSGRKYVPYFRNGRW